MLERPNIVLITVDCLRADFVNEKNTPYLLELADKNGVALQNVYTSGMPTYYAVPSILTSTYPFDFGPLVGVPKNVPTIAEVLRNSGYYTIAFASHNAYTSRLLGCDRGFDIFEDNFSTTGATSSKKFKQFVKKAVETTLSKNAKESLEEAYGKMLLFLEALTIKKPPYKDAEKILNDVKVQINGELSKKSPFFIWIHIMDVHEPYLPDLNSLPLSNRIKWALLTSKQRTLHKKGVRLLTQAYQNNVPPIRLINETSSIFSDKIREINLLKDIYSLSVKKVDFLLSSFVEEMIKSLPNAYFMITSDHGEEFMECCSHLHLSLFHNKYLVEVPLLIIGDDIKNASINSSVFSTIDIGPTLCDIAGIETPQTWKGKSILRQTDAERVVFTESSFAFIPRVIRNQCPKTKAKINLIIEKPKYLISAHSKGKASTTVLEGQIAPPGSYQGRDLEKEALQFYRNRVNRDTLFFKLQSLKNKNSNRKISF